MNFVRIYRKLHEFLNSLSDKRRYFIFERIRKTQAKRLTKLTPSQINSIKSLYSKYHKITTYAHSFYTHVTGKFNPRYIPDSLWYAYIEPYYNNRTLAKALDDKTLYNRLLCVWGVIHPQNIAYMINGFWIDGDNHHIQVSDILEKAELYDTLFLKEATDSAGGHGVRRFKMPEDKADLKEALSKANRNLVLQIGIIQHPLINSLNPSSVNTIRLLTHITKDEEVILRSAVVRIGRPGAFVDNASSGGYTVGINNDGSLKNIGYDIDGNKYYTATDGMTKLASIKIPNYERLILEIKNLAWQLPMFRLLSWDIALDESGEFVLIEVNMHSGQLDFHQMNNGPVFGDDTEAVLKEVFGKT